MRAGTKLPQVETNFSYISGRLLETSSMPLLNFKNINKTGASLLPRSKLLNTSFHFKRIFAYSKSCQVAVRKDWLWKEIWEHSLSEEESFNCSKSTLKEMLSPGPMAWVWWLCSGATAGNTSQGDTASSHREPGQWRLGFIPDRPVWSTSCARSWPTSLPL